VATNVMRKLNPHDRSTRNADIVAARAAGVSWRRIGERFDLSGRQARRIVKDVGASVTNTTVIDPIAIIEAAVLRCEALIEQLADIADTAHPAVAIRAIRAQVRAAESEMALLQNAGLLPTPLSRIGYEMDAHRAGSRAVEVLNRHGVSAEAKAELIAALRAP
jgi:phytoene/squalene synthetase